MHAHFWIRGEIWAVDQVIKWLSTRMVMYPFKDKDGKQMYQPLNLGIRYSIFGTFEAIFPEEEKDAVLTTLGFHKELHPNTLKMKWALNMMRLALGLEKIPEFTTEKVLPMPNEIMDVVSIIPIGVKYDVKDWKFSDGTTREFL